MSVYDFSGPDHCGDCGHFHRGDCPDPGSDCGSYLCCHTDDLSVPCCEGTPGCTSTHIFDNDECEL